ncbi:MAG TPA: tetratricopeptide repeat protein [Kiritimatiellia bacterium]|nr:tetratricopeptide repeat protein [Kiritimatiellia bacterium]HRZ12045.1 tetratricopeptide repeat protein [Kiritimatiellia bacterium]HSA19624.1 tetratricopeptide repeat protein [Kiritimatiellia bacterium]
MDPLSHSVYHVRDKAPAGAPPAAGPPQAPEGYWAESQRQLRRQTLLFVLTVLVSGLLIVVVTTYYYLQISESRQVARTPRRTLERPASPLRFEADAQTMYLLEELKPPAAPEELKDLPLTSASLKQAAYYLVKAERAAKQERFDDALDSYQKVAQIFPDIRGVQGQVGLLAIRLKQFAVAAEAFEKASREEPMTFSMANNLGVAYMGMEDYDKAEASFLTATRMNPQYANSYFNLATLYLRRGQPDKASQRFEEYMTLQPGDTMAGQTYALILLQLEQWDRAAKLLQQIARVAPDVAPIHFRLAQALSHGNSPESAIDALKRAISLVDPKQALAWMSRPEFDLVRNDPGFQELLLELGAQD